MQGFKWPKDWGKTGQRSTSCCFSETALFPPPKGEDSPNKPPSMIGQTNWTVQVPALTPPVRSAGGDPFGRPGSIQSAILLCCQLWEQQTQVSKQGADGCWEPHTTASRTDSNMSGRRKGSSQESRDHHVQPCPCVCVSSPPPPLPSHSTCSFIQEVGQETAHDGLVGDDQDVALTLQLHDDRLQSLYQVLVGLREKEGELVRGQVHAGSQDAG